MLKKIASACVVLGIASAAHAQSSVQIYGIMDLAVEHLNNVGPGKDDLTRMPSLTGSAPSRLGFRGTEDLGGGLHAGFNLEMWLNPDSGQVDNGGRGFGRIATVSLGGPWGDVSVGRQRTMLFWSILDADVIGPNMHSMANFDPFFVTDMVDNSISYLGRFSGFTVGANYSFGRDKLNAGPSPAGTNCAGESASDKKACRAWSVVAKYDAARWGVAVAHDVIHGGPGAFDGLTSSNLSDTRTMFNGYFNVASLKVGGGYMRRKNEGHAQPRSDLWFLGASYPMGDFSLDAQYNLYKTKDSSDKGQLVVLRGTYNLSKRSAVYASLGFEKNSGSAAYTVSGAQPGANPMPGVNQTGFGVGIRHVF